MHVSCQMPMAPWCLSAIMTSLVVSKNTMLQYPAGCQRSCQVAGTLRQTICRFGAGKRCEHRASPDSQAKVQPGFHWVIATCQDLPMPPICHNVRSLQGARHRAFEMLGEGREWNGPAEAQAVPVPIKAAEHAQKSAQHLHMQMPEVRACS